jgi:hypothetical protein
MGRYFLQFPQQQFFVPDRQSEGELEEGWKSGPIELERLELERCLKPPGCGSLDRREEPEPESPIIAIPFA